MQLGWSGLRSYVPLYGTIDTTMQTGVKSVKVVELLRMPSMLIYNDSIGGFRLLQSGPPLFFSDLGLRLALPTDLGHSAFRIADAVGAWEAEVTKRGRRPGCIHGPLLCNGNHSSFNSAP